MTDAGTGPHQMTHGEAVFWARVNWAGLLISTGLVAFEAVRGAYEWLRYGEAEKVILADWLNVPQWKWIGVQRIFDFVWGLPVWMIAFAAIFLFGWLWGGYDDKVKALGEVK